jgi:hypothetical protein
VGHGNGFALCAPGIDAVVSKGLGHGIEFIQELIASDPQRAGAIFEQRGNEDPAQTVVTPRFVLEHFELVAIVAIDPILRTKPHEALIVLHNLDYPCL